MARRRLLLAALAAALLAGGAALLVWRPWTPRGDAHDAPQRSTAKAPSPVRVTPHATLTGAPSASRGESGAEIPDYGGRSDPGPPVETRLISLVGSLRFSDGSPALGEARVEMHSIDTKQARVLVATGADGRLAMEALEEGKYAVQSVEVGGQTYGLPVPDVEVRGGTPVEIVLETPGNATIAVVDAATHEPVPEAKAWPAGIDADAARSPWLVLPTARLGVDPIVGDRAGSIHLPPSWGESAWFVIAPGRAWATAVVKYGSGEPTRVELHPGGSLRVLVPGWDELQQGHRVLHVAREAIPDSFDLPVDSEGEDFTFEGVPAGPCRLSVRGPGREAHVYGWALTEVTAGQTTTVRIMVSEAGTADDAARVTLRGLLHIPAAWGSEPVELRLVRHDDEDEFRPGSEDEPPPPSLTLRPSASGAVPFSFDSLVHGVYSLHIQPMGVACRVVVIGGSATPLDVVVPEPCTVEVAVVDSRTGATVLGADVDLSPAPTEVDGYRGWVQAAFDGAKRRYVCRVPQGRCEVSATHPRYEFGSAEPFEAARERPATPEVRLERAGPRIYVRLRLNGQPSFPPHPWAVIVHRAQVPEEPDSMRGGVSGLSETILDMPSAGRWIVRVEGLADHKHQEAIDGFEPVAPKEVDVGADETLEVVFDIVRKK